MINFIQLGANRGKTDSDIMWWLVPEKGWNGIFVEPLPDAFEILKEHYTYLTDSFFEQIAVVGNEKYKKHVAHSLKLTGKREIGINPKGRIGTASTVCNIKSNGTDVPAMTLMELLEKYSLKGVEFDLLQIDVEGSDWDILTSTDFNVALPKIIRVETIHMSDNQKKSLRKHLGNFDYEEIEDPYWECFAELVPQHFKNKRGAPQKPESRGYNTVYRRKN